MDYSAFYSITSVRIRVIIPVITIRWIEDGSLVHIFFPRFSLFWPHYNSSTITSGQEINYQEKDILEGPTTKKFVHQASLERVKSPIGRRSMVNGGAW